MKVNDISMGQKTDKRSEATDGSSASAISILKQISYLLQNSSGGTGTSGEVTQDIHDDLNCNANLQINDIDVSSGNPIPVDIGAGNLTVEQSDKTKLLGTMELSDGSAVIGKVTIDQTTDGTTNKVNAQNATHDNLNCNANMQISNTDVASTNPVFTTLEDGKNVTLGSKADNRSDKTDTTEITAMQVLKQISYMLQNPANISLGSSIPSGTNNIGDVDIVSLPSLPVGDNNIGNVDIASSIPSGTNNIGKVDIEHELPTGTKKIGSIDIANSIPAGDNNIGNVDLASSIPAGTNVIGKAVISDAAGNAVTVTNNKLAVDISGATIEATITEVGLKAGTNNIGDVDIASSLPSGDNNIGNVDIVTIASGQNIKPSTTPAVYNVTCTNADTEYSQALPSNCKSFIIGLKSKLDNVTWVLKFAAGGTEFSLNGTESYSQDNVLFSSQTLYFESNVAGEIIQIIALS